MGGDFVQLYLFNGGTGATGVSNGANAMSMPVNCANVPIEVMEARSPCLFERKQLLPGSGGAGQFHGGLGQEVFVRSLADGPLDFVPRSAGRIVHPPLGLRGGQPGSGGAIEIDGNPSTSDAHTACTQTKQSASQSQAAADSAPPNERGISAHAPPVAQAEPSATRPQSGL